MSKCRYDLSADCNSNDCVSCVLDKARAEMLEEILLHSGTGEEVIQAYADGLKKGLDILDKYKTEVEVTPQFSSGLDKNSKRIFGESDCINRDSAIKALDYDIKCFEFKPGVSKHMDDIAKLLNTIYETQVNNIKTLPSVPQAIPIKQLEEMYDKFQKKLWREHEDVRGDDMIEVGYAEQFLQELLMEFGCWDSEEQ